MPKEVLIKLTQKPEVFTAGKLIKKLYEASVEGADAAGISVLSTNDKGGKPAVYVEHKGEPKQTKVRFELDGQRVRRVFSHEIAPGMIEYYLSQSARKAQVRFEENAAYNEHSTYSQRRATQEVATDVLPPEYANDPDMPVPLDYAELDQLALETAEVEGKYIPLLKANRYTDAQRDKVYISILSPFADVATTQLQCSMHFRYMRKGETEIRTDGTKTIVRMKKGEIADNNQPINLNETIYFNPSEKFELVLVVEDLVSLRRAERVITSEEIGAAQPLPTEGEQVQPKPVLSE